MISGVSAIFGILLSFAPWHGDSETLAERRARLGVVAEAIYVASEGDAERVAFLVMTGREESNLAHHIHAGRCGKHPKSPRGECDSGRAASLWQVQRGAWLPLADWRAIQGADYAPTLRAARLSLALYERGRRACGSPEGGISMYATGRSCSWARGKSRARSLEQIRLRYVAASNPQK